MLVAAPRALERLRREPGRAEACRLREATRCAQLTTMLTPDGNPERIDWAASVAELAEAGAMPDVPLVVLAATSPGAEMSPEEVERSLARQQELVDSVRPAA